VILGAKADEAEFSTLCTHNLHTTFRSHSVGGPNANRMGIIGFSTKDQIRKTYKVAVDLARVTGLRRGGGESGIKVIGSSKV
jgi:hypothetical protein